MRCIPFWQWTALARDRWTRKRAIARSKEERHRKVGTAPCPRPSSRTRTHTGPDAPVCFYAVLHSSALCTFSMRRGVERDLDWEPATAKRPGPLMAPARNPSSAGQMPPPPPPPKPTVRAMAHLEATSVRCAGSEALQTLICQHQRQKQSFVDDAPSCPQAWWEAPFTSRRNIALTMLAGSAGVWLLNNSKRQSEHIKAAASQPKRAIAAPLPQPCLSFAWQPALAKPCNAVLA